VHCPSCESENRPGRRFCLACGSPISRTCPACGADNEGQAAFCGECGTTLDPATPARRDDGEAEYDPAAALERLVPREFAERLRATRGHVGHERRLVTMLFCDIRGSTPMAETLDPEDVLEIVNGAFEHLIAPVYRHEGTVAEMRGDAILAFFGAPVGHEDDPVRAVRAALDIQAGIRDYAARLRAERGIEGFSVRIGIHTGVVVVGEVGSDLRVAYTAVGDAINLAARMEQNAPAGGILVSAETWRSIAEDFFTVPQPPLTVKGHVAPVDTYLVERPLPAAIGARTRRIEGVETRLIGRDAELRQLEAALDAALDGRGGGIVLVTGDPGVGKSRLVGELVRVALDRPKPPDTWMGRATPTGIATPYGLLRDLWARRCGILDSDSAAVARERFERDVVGVFGDDASGVMRAHVLGQLLGFDYAGSPYLRGLLDDPRQVRNRARVYVADYLRSVSTTRPLIVLLEDLHWADDSSLNALPELAMALGDRPALFVATARQALDERHPGWTSAVPGMLRLALEPLDAAASEELVAEILRRADRVPAALRNMIVGRSEGNPFFAEELVKMLLEDGVIERSPGDEHAWRVRADRLGEVRIPPGLTGVLQARLDRLEPEERATLQRASVVGRRFWDRAVTRLAAADNHPTDSARAPAVTAASLAVLERRELAFERTPSTFADCREYVFKHALVRDVAYESLLRRQRRAYHGAAADWLLGAGGDRADETAGIMGTHLELAGRGAEAARQYARAASRAAAAFANDEAIDLFRRALRLDRELPPESRDREISAGLAEDLGNVLHLLRRHEAARLEYRSALADVPSDDAVTSARLRRLIANTWVGDGRFEEADAAFDEAEAALGPVLEVEEAARPSAPVDAPARAEPELRRWREWMALQNDRMLARYWAFRDDELDALVGRMRPVVERWGSPAERSGFYQALVMAELRRYRYVLPVEVVEHARLQLEASRDLGLPDRLAWPWFFLGFACLWQGNLAAAEAHMATSLEIAERTGDVTTEARCVTYLALAARIRNDAGRVASLVGRGVDIVTRAAMPEYLGVVHGNESWLAYRAGDLDAAERFGALAQASAVPPFRWTWLWPFVGAALARGDLETAIGRARDLLAPDEQRTSDDILVPLEAALGAWDEGDVTVARARLEEAATAARLTGRL
jgi:class 3 adenylate cyclase/tetratricopeptide (TPR) repeat protein